MPKFVRTVLQIMCALTQGDDEKIKEVIKKYKGHALSLTLLTGFLKKHFKGDVGHAPDVKFVLNDKKRFEDVNKLCPDVY